MATDNKKTLLLEMLDGLYREIRSLEDESGLKAGRRDLRPPVEAYHDLIRAWSAGDAAHPDLTVSSVAFYLQSMRQRSRWMGAGPHIYWEDQDDQHEKTAKLAREQKRSLIRHARDVDVPEEIMLLDIMEFQARYGRDTEGLRQQLRYRVAERYRPPSRHAATAHGSWERLEPEDFLNGMIYLGGFFQQLKHASKNAPAMLEEESVRKTHLPVLDAKAAIAEQGRRALANIWLQIMHPLALRAAFKTKSGVFGGKARSVFDPKRHVAESDWQYLGTLGLRLQGHYEKYAMLFAAALADTVNDNYKVELEELDDLVRDASKLLRRIEEMERGGPKLSIAQLQRLLHEVDNPELKRRIAMLLKQERVDTSSSQSGGGNKIPPAQLIKKVMKQVDQEIDRLEQEHMNFLTGQLSSYEESKDLIKQLAAQGLNLAGKFTEAVAGVSAARDKGQRGR
ncbi:hypothetical protein GC177_10510 [bacterium]|nr:hypothetical protein [bacterium]